MVTTVEYALLAGASYFETRSAINRLPPPQAWSVVSRVPADSSSGFEASAFARDGEVVISYSGTDPAAGLIGSGDWENNFALINGKWSEQLLQAAEYYLQIKSAHPGASITLTGHSLGGGLAALVGVFFGVTATTFDQGPFRQSASALSDNAQTLLNVLRSRFTGSGGDALLAPLAAYLQLRTPDSIPRAELVSTVLVKGESLDSRFLPYSRIGNEPVRLDNGQTTSGGNLHSHTLLTAFLQSRETAPSGAALNEATVKLSGLLPVLFDKSFYAFGTGGNNDKNVNFLDHLVRHEAGGIGGVPAGGDAMLTHFTADLNKIATGIEGLSKQAQDALSASSRRRWLLAGAGLLLTLAGCVAAQVPDRFSWREEVQLHDGGRIIVERAVLLGGGREPGQRPPIREQTLVLRPPGSSHDVSWTDAFSPDIGTAAFLPMMLEVHHGALYLVAHPMGCLSYNKWGRPNPPYVVFRYGGHQWKRIDLAELPTELQTPNLVFSSPDEQAERLGQSLISAEAIKRLYAGYRQPEFRSILRAPLTKEYIADLCEERVLYKGFWVLPNDPVARKIIDQRTQ